MDNTHQVDARYQYRFAYGDIVFYPLGEGAAMEVRHQERDGILPGGQEGYEGRMPRLPALLS